MFLHFKSGSWHGMCEGIFYFGDGVDVCRGLKLAARFDCFGTPQGSELGACILKWMSLEPLFVL